MSSTATTRLRLQKQGTGDNSGTWGALLNAALDLIDTAAAGVSAFTVSTSKTLTSTDYVADESRAFVLNITGGTGGTLTIPSVEKVYIVKNAASGTVTIGNGGTTVAVAAGASALIWTNGTNVYSVDYTLSSMTSAQLAAAISDETGSGSLVFGTAPTLSNPVVGTQSRNDNSTKGASTAYADRVVQWNTLETLATTSGTTITTAATLTAYNDLLFEFLGVSHASASTVTIQIALYDGSNWTTARDILTAGVPASQTLRGSVWLPDRAAQSGLLIAGLFNSSSSPTLSGSSLSMSLPWFVTTGVVGARFTVSDGSAFDAGSILVKGR